MAAKAAEKFPKLPDQKTKSGSSIKEDVDSDGTKEIPIAARLKGPGPAAYTLPSTLGSTNCKNIKRAPAYSFGTKIVPRSPEKTPGPNTFFPTATRNGPSKGPAFSLQGGYKKPRVNLGTPGPGNYNPQYISPSEPKAPAYSIGGRAFNDKPNKTPGPAQYMVAATLGINKNVTMKSAAAYTIKPPRPTKLQIFSPGPAAYSSLDPSKIKTTAPAYSLGGRWNNAESNPFPDDGAVVASPGPGQYTPSVKMSKTAPPTYTFRCKHSDYELFIPDVSEDGQLLV